jgi:flavodoxin
MKPLVIYASRGGKTRKVAEAIADELGCKASENSGGVVDVSDVDLLLIGSGTYGGNPDPKLLEFINSLPMKESGKAAVFVTSAGPEPKSLAVLKNALEGKGYIVLSTFSCRGQFLISNRGHPNADDLQNASKFAGALVK